MTLSPTAVARLRPSLQLFCSRRMTLPSVLSSVSPSHAHVRHSSYVPMGGDSPKPRKKVTINTLRNMYKKCEPIAMITAHDYPSASLADAAGMDMILVGDSLAMVALGMEDTSEVTLDQMIMHCRSVARAAKSTFILCDLPMGSFEVSPEQALKSAIRVIKEGRAHAVKMEGGAEVAPMIKKVTTAGIPVVAHIGLTPQRQNQLGGFRVQGKNVAGAVKLLQDAYAVQEAGAFLVVLEAMPPEIANMITKKLRIPTMGIGAGNGCSGQVLVQVDMSGYFPPGRPLPKFVKQYANVWNEAFRGIEQYRAEVKSRAFPSEEYTYPIPKEEVEEIEKALEGADQSRGS